MENEITLLKEQIVLLKEIIKAKDEIIQLQRQNAFLNIPNQSPYVTFKYEPPIYCETNINNNTNRGGNKI